MRNKLSYANVMVTLLAFVVLAGGTAFAATKLAKNSVGTKQIKKSSVTAAKVKDGSLLAQDFKAGQLPKGERGATGERGLTGDRGPQGAPGATNVVVRYGEEGKPKEEEESDQSDAKCLPGEAVTGGGLDLLEGPEPPTYILLADRPSAGETEVGGELVYPAPSDGSPADGWLVEMQNESVDTIFFRAYVMCARP
jgi:hypothetical protein